MNKTTLLTYLFSLIITICSSQARSSNNSEIINVNEISYELDTSNWYSQKSSNVVDFMKRSGLVSQFSEDEIIATYTYKKYPVLNYPSIMIVNTTASADPPPMDQLEKEIGAITFSLNDVDPTQKLRNYINNWDFSKPILIKEKKQIIMESKVQLEDGSNLKIRQTMFFRKRKMLIIQISYITHRDEKHLEDFQRIIETIKF